MAKVRLISCVAVALFWLVYPTAAPLAEEDVNFFKVEPPVIVPVIAGTRLMGQISFAITLDLMEDVDRSEVIYRLPRLRDAFLVELKHFAEQHRNILRSIPIKGVKRLLLAISTRILGEGQVRAVLIQRADVYQFQ